MPELGLFKTLSRQAPRPLFRSGQTPFFRFGTFRGEMKSPERHHGANRDPLKGIYTPDSCLPKQLDFMLRYDNMKALRFVVAMPLFNMDMGISCLYYGAS